MSVTHFSGPVESDQAFNIGDIGVANSCTQSLILKTAIPDNTATTLFTITIPNANQSATIKINGRAAITNASHTYDSTRVWDYRIVVTRVAGAAAVAAISAVVGAQIATVASGQTLTSAVTLAAVAGGAAASNTVAVQVTNVNASAGTSECQVFAEVMNATGVLAQGTTNPTGITIA